MSVSKSKLGMNYDTRWARAMPARIVRALMISTITRPFVSVIATPNVNGLDRLDGVEGPVIFVSNHSSHLDTSVILATLPARFRRKVAIAAGSDYFFDKLWKAIFWALWINVIPLERDKVSRRSIEMAEGVVRDGWNLVIYPEGTRGADYYSEPFRPGAAYLSQRSNAPVVPIHLHGTRRIFTPYTKKLRPGRTRVTFGSPLYPQADEKPRDFNRRVEQAVERCADESNTDWWAALRRSSKGVTPTLRAPEGLTGWRRNWSGTARYTRSGAPRWPF